MHSFVCVCVCVCTYISVFLLSADAAASLCPDVDESLIGFDEAWDLLMRTSDFSAQMVFGGGERGKKCCVVVCVCFSFITLRTCYFF